MDMNIIFFGADTFALPILNKLMDDKSIKLCAVVTRPAKPAGRGLKPEPNAVLHESKKLNLPITLVDSNSDWDAVNKLIKSIKPDAIIVAALGRMIPQETLDLLPNKYINIHPSLLPLYRGPAPIESAILEGDSQTGVSIMILENKMDAGPLLAQFKVDINNENAVELSGELAKLSSIKIVRVVSEYLNGSILPKPQNEDQATYTHIISKNDGNIDLSDDPIEIDRKIRAFFPWPGTTIEIDGVSIKLIEAHVEDKTLIIDTIQPAGKRAMSAKEFSNGYKKLLTSFPKNVKLNLINQRISKKG